MRSMSHGRFTRLTGPAIICVMVGGAALRSLGQDQRGFGMGPPCTPEIVAAADAAVTKPMPAGLFQANWDSIKAGYKVPQWFVDAKFGLFMHWGLYSVPAYHNEWYEKHMYATYRQWHAEHFGPQDKFGYKDFIPMFTCEKFNADEWATLFKKSGAKYVVPTAEHHDNFAMWDSDLTHIDAKEMGPKRDLIGELGAAVRRQGLKFGVSNHGIENFTFIQPAADLAADLKAKGVDLFDPKWQDIYHFADKSDLGVQKFLTDWVNRNLELIDKYQVDMLWFDNGVNHRFYDPLKLHVAAYYYNRSKEWGKEVSISTKDSAYAPQGGDTHQIGSIVDFEKIGSRSPSDIRTGAWQVDEAIYGTRPWTRYGEGPYYDAPAADQRGADNPPSEAYSAKEIRFTTKGDTLYAIVTDWPGEQAIITSLASGKSEGKVTRVELLGHSRDLQFTQDFDGLKVKFPSEKPCDAAYALKITGVKTH